MEAVPVPETGNSHSKHQIYVGAQYRESLMKRIVAKTALPVDESIKKPKYRYKIANEPGAGLMIRGKVGESIFFEFGGRKIEVIIWGANQINPCSLCIRAPKDVTITRDKENVLYPNSITEDDSDE